MTTWDDIIAAVGVAVAGHTDDGRRELTACWERTSEADYAQRCVIAHYLADLQPHLGDEVGWDEQALQAYPHLTDEDLAPIGIPAARGLAPSLHLNLGDGYLRQGRLADAHTQLVAGLAAEDALGDDGYGRLIRQGLAGLQERITAKETR
ncbi:hypothetical protein [Lapillicoccus sp.]|uniref:hypothetical protein n=1 Tax=Lapillicoccus sp. TaxID=1909287 RepID=UPI00326667CB